MGFVKAVCMVHKVFQHNLEGTEGTKVQTKAVSAVLNMIALHNQATIGVLHGLIEQSLHSTRGNECHPVG